MIFQSTAICFQFYSEDPDLPDLPIFSEVTPTPGSVNNYALPTFVFDTTGTISRVGNDWTIDFGTIEQYSEFPLVNVSIENAAPVADSDFLSGSISASIVDPISFTDPSVPAGPGNGLLTGFAGFVDSTVLGEHTDSFVFSPESVNAAGSYTLPTQTLTITADITATPCYLAGTLLLTPGGEVPVEMLKAGDAVVTISGEKRKLVWIGKGRALATRGQRSAATPVIIRKGALAKNVPHRDLRITKGHSLYLERALIPVELLVNHRSILWDDRAQDVTVYHLELETHDVLLANGAPAESYRDDGNRWLFQNANSGWDLPPQQPCAPILTGGPVVDAIWRQLLDRAGLRKGVPLTDDPDVHILVDGKRLNAADRVGDVHVFHLAGVPSALRIMSRSSVPAELGLARDPRLLGVAVRCVVVRNGARFRALQMEDARLAEGFHDFEPDNRIRWTDGDAAVPVELFKGFIDPLEFVLHLGGTTKYLDCGEVRHVA